MGMLKRGLLVGLRTTWTLGKIIFPITLIVTILGYTPIFGLLAKILAPLMSWMGLPGEAAIPLVLGNMLNLYAAIGAILTMDLTIKEVFTLAVMLSFSHNLFVESAVAAKVGISMFIVILVRVGLAVVSAGFINLVCSGGQEKANYGLIQAPSSQEVTGWAAIIMEGLTSATLGIISLAAIVIPIMIFIQIMKEKNGLGYLVKWMKPLTKLIGVKENTATTLGAGLVFGLAYGAGVMIQAVKEDNVSKKDLYLVFIFLVACHAVIEDTLLFVPLGIPVWPLLLFRLVVAILLTAVVAVVWNRYEKKQENLKIQVQKEGQ